MSSFIILTRNGVADPGQEQLLSDLAADLQKAGAKLLLHLHGGLVDQASGEAAAQRLSGSGPNSWQLNAEWTQVALSRKPVFTGYYLLVSGCRNQ
jgi:hypothetical protein